MTVQSTLQDAVDHWSSEPDNDDKVLEFVSEYGTYCDAVLTEHSVTTNNGKTRIFHTAPELSQELLDIVVDFIQDYEPRMKECYANAAELSRYDSRIDYVDGVTASSDTGTVHDHAWNEVDGIPVDVTRTSDERYGVSIPNRILRDALPVFENTNQWNLLSHPEVATSLKPPYDDEE